MLVEGSSVSQPTVKPARLLAREPAPPEVERAVRAPGREIPARVRAPFEAAFGRDFSTVRVQHLARLQSFADSHDRSALTSWRARLGEPTVTRHRTPLGEVRRMARASKTDVADAGPQQLAAQPATATGAGTTGPPAQVPATGPSAARVREWPSALPAASAPRPADLDDAQSELSQIIAAVQANRAAVADVIKDTWQRPALKSEVGSKTKTTMTADQVQALTPAE